MLCVAFANRRGVNLLQPQLSGLGRRCRLLVTSVFGGQTTGDALAAAADLRVHVRILNPPAGTFHSKLYLAKTPSQAVAVVGSANLTSGLIANIESALVLSGTVRDPPIAECWTLARSSGSTRPPVRGRRPNLHRTPIGSSPTCSACSGGPSRSVRPSRPSPRAVQPHRRHHRARRLRRDRPFPLTPSRRSAGPGLDAPAGLGLPQAVRRAQQPLPARRGRAERQAVIRRLRDPRPTARHHRHLNETDRASHQRASSSQSAAASSPQRRRDPDHDRRYGSAAPTPAPNRRRHVSRSHATLPRVGYQVPIVESEVS